MLMLISSLISVWMKVSVLTLILCFLNCIVVLVVGRTWLFDDEQMHREYALIPIKNDEYESALGNGKVYITL